MELDSIVQRFIKLCIAKYYVRQQSSFYTREAKIYQETYIQN